MPTAIYTAKWEQEVISNALQLPSVQRMPASEDHASGLQQTNRTVCFGSGPLPVLTGPRFWNEGKRTLPCTLVFMLAMAAISIACEISDWLLGHALLAWFSLTLDPFILSVVLHLVVTLIGTGVAISLSKATPDSAARRHMLLTLLAAMAIGLILTWLSHLVGYKDALDWPLVLVYLLWAGAAAVSAA
jgi:hypothetical protein